jgi:hypothetical protein
MSILGAEVDDAQDNFFLDIALWCWLYLAAKLSQVRADVDGLACPLHHLMTYSRQTGGEGFLSGTVLSYRAVVGDGAFLGDMKPPTWIFGVVLTVWVPVLPNLIWSKSFLLGHAYPMSEPSWHLGVYPWSSYYVRR